MAMEGNRGKRDSKSERQTQIDAINKRNAAKIAKKRAADALAKRRALAKKRAVAAKRGSRTKVASGSLVGLLSEQKKGSKFIAEYTVKKEC